MIMKYIISESRLQDIFDKYMESTYDLRYYSEAREFRVKVRWGNIFGDLWEQRFFYAYQSEEDLLKSIFGEDTNKLLLIYLRNKFPEVGIRGIGNSPPESLL